MANLLNQNYTFDDKGNLIIKLTEKDLLELKMKKISNYTPNNLNSNKGQNNEPEKQRKKYHREKGYTYCKTNTPGVYYNPRMDQYTARICCRDYKTSKTFAVGKYGKEEAYNLAAAKRAEFVKTFTKIKKGKK
jgi:hypothetical protein